MDPSKVVGGLVALVLKPLETLVLVALAVAGIAGLGVYLGWWTQAQAVSAITPPLEIVAKLLLMILAPFSDLGLIVGLAYCLHSLKRGLEVAVCAAVVAGISWHFGGQDWMASVPALFGHPGAR